MTAVLSPADPLRRDRLMSFDDNQINYSTSSTDWRAKYNEVADMLAETRTELDDFHHASKELEAELESELQRTEKAQQDLKVKVARAESERDEWKSKFMSLQTNHNTTTTSLQRELDTLRQEHQATKIQLRELEMGNDDLERTERAVSSSLADIEAKYSRALEEKILLEHELLDKANLEEECQRIKDELRDATVEISILKDQLASQSSTSVAENVSVALPRFPQLSISSDDDLLNTLPPPDLQLSELAPSTDSLPTSVEATPRGPSTTAQSALQRAKFRSTVSTPPSSGIARSSTLPSLYSGSPRTPVARQPVARNPSTMSTTSTTSTTSRNKGVQMVSEMRARVKNLEQKIHTRVPRLRMGSITGQRNANALAISTIGNGTGSSSKGAGAKSSWESLTKRSVDTHRKSNDSDSEKNKKGESSGWVLIMEDSPSPPKDERRRASSPLGALSFRPAASTSAAVSPTLGTNKTNPLAQSTMQTGLRRPQSRLSGGSLSTVATTSSIPTPSSRPSTPTFLPLPTGGLYAHSSTAGLGLKRSTGPGAPNPFSTKRSSLGASTAGLPPPSDRSRDRPTTMPPPPRPSSESKALPQLPGLHSNVTMRTSSKLPGTSSSLLSQSRIGRPSSGRKSAGDTDVGIPSEGKKDLRPRAGSTAASTVLSKDDF